MKRLSFTLLELIIVIAIVMMLMTLLSPSLNKMRRTSLSLKCAQNQKAIGMATFMFADDYAGEVSLCQWRGTAFQYGNYHDNLRRGVYLGPYLNADNWEENNCPDAVFAQGYDVFIVRGARFIATEANYSGFSNYTSRIRSITNNHVISPSADKTQGWDKYSVVPILSDPVFQIGGWSRNIGWNSTNAVFHGRISSIPVLMSDGSVRNFDQTLFTPTELLSKHTIAEYVLSQ
jgi:type II secretory pathway pseudopilin PulG